MDFVQPGQGFPASRVKMLVEQAQLFVGTSVVYVCRLRQGQGNSDSKVFRLHQQERENMQTGYMLAMTLFYPTLYYIKYVLSYHGAC